MNQCQTCDMSIPPYITGHWCQKRRGKVFTYRRNSATRALREPCK